MARIFLLGLGAACGRTLALLGPGAAFASDDTTLQEVVVSARKRGRLPIFRQTRIVGPTAPFLGRDGGAIGVEGVDQNVELLGDDG